MVRCKNCFWVSLCSGATYIFLFLSILTSGFDLILGSFFDFLGLHGAIFGDFVLGDYFLRVFCPMDFFTFEFWGILS